MSLMPQLAASSFLEQSFAESPGIDSGTAISIVFLYDTGCSTCESVGPVIRQAVSEAENGVSREILYRDMTVTSADGLEYVNKYGFISIPVVIINDHTILGSQSLEDPVNLKQRVIRSIEGSAGYKIPLTVEIERIKPDGSLAAIEASIKNTGNETLDISIFGGECKDPDMPGRPVMRSARLLPDKETKLEYVITFNEEPAAVPLPVIHYEDSYGFHMLAGKNTTAESSADLSPAVVFFAGIAAGFSPCILAILAFISTMSAAINGKVRDTVLYIAAFTTGMLTVYMITGIGILEMLSRTPGLETIINLVLFALLLALSGIAFYMSHKKPYTTGNGEGAFARLLKVLKPYYEKYRISGSFFIGILFGLTKMPCAGGIYLAVLSEIIVAKDYENGFMYLILYDSGVVLPVFLIGFLITCGCSSSFLTGIRLKYRTGLYLLTGLSLLVIAFSIIL